MTDALACVACGDPIPDVRAAYGPVAEPLCQSCWFEFQEEQGEDWYGLAPHTHDLSKTGTYIGSTEFLPLPISQWEGGWIDCSFMGESWRGTWFRPDPDDPQMGVYSRDPLHVYNSLQVTL